MVEKGAEWILPENLKVQEEVEREKVDSGVFSGDGDFGAHYAYRKGINLDHIKKHAISDDKVAFEYIENLGYFLSTLNMNMEGKVLDAGCAIGTITNAINNVNMKGKTFGIDISEDAIFVAREKYDKCIFYNGSADDLKEFQDGHFDVIHAKEFYPFTRTMNHEYCLRYFKAFYKKLKKGGFVILQMTDSGNGLENIFEELQKKLTEAGYEKVFKKIMIPVRMSNILGGRVYRKFLCPFLSMIVRMKGYVKRSKAARYYILIK